MLRCIGREWHLTDNSVAQYHLSPESKFLHGEYLDRGPTCRRHVEATVFHHIGKEANRWEEQFYLGVDESQQIDYGLAPGDSKKLFFELRNEAKTAGQRNIAREAAISRRTISRFVEGKQVRKEIVAKIVGALRTRKA